MVALLADIPSRSCLENPGRWREPVPPDLQAPRRRPSPVVLRRRRAIAAVLLISVLMAAVFGLQAALGRIGGSPLATTGAPGAAEPAASKVWIVRPGDTLWSIAEAVDPGGDVRPLVDRLAAETGSTLLYPGEAVSLPGG